nr:immunoglobulin light chain junction region [Macaca mulatta]MOV92280.1 immunoglobulin light chain junction region [Macaca mulatta]MOV92400.1 immunoglobulin light chain junction region [Macaca mulatta]MOV92471.1 immunoglobulin light chain junction region [Macaca mulatta]MOV92556.1 immunoglobulin light chain junction region [Macaca mulatta]
CLQDVQLPPTF